MKSGKLTIVGGTYIESCQEPTHFDLFGSGLRAAAALCGHVKELSFFSCIGNDYGKDAESVCKTFGLSYSFTRIKQTIEFSYYHPLSTPSFDQYEQATMPPVADSNVLYYGMLEARTAVQANWLVYDPQNQIAFQETGSSAERLAIVLNANEARLLSGMKRKRQPSLEQMGREILRSSGATAVVVKNGVFGAILVNPSGTHHIPVYETAEIWPIGSGDIFSAVFALNWAIKKKSALESAHLASRFTAHYCQNPTLPLPVKAITFKKVHRKKLTRKVYLAGPFFTVEERWIINELFEVLQKLGNKVFSPLHHIGISPSSSSDLELRTTAQKDLVEIKKSDIVFAVLNRPDPGTLFEIGFARANDVKVVVFSQSLNAEDRLMLVGSGCEIIADLSTATYRASW